MLRGILLGEFMALIQPGRLLTMIVLPAGISTVFIFYWAGVGCLGAPMIIAISAAALSLEATYRDRRNIIYRGFLGTRGFFMLLFIKCLLPTVVLSLLVAICSFSSTRLTGGMGAYFLSFLPGAFTASVVAVWVYCRTERLLAGAASAVIPALLLNLFCFSTGWTVTFRIFSAVFLFIANLLVLSCSAFRYRRGIDTQSRLI